MVGFPGKALSQSHDQGEVKKESEVTALNTKFEEMPKNSVIKIMFFFKKKNQN